MISKMTKSQIKLEGGLERAGFLGLRSFQPESARNLVRFSLIFDS